jgi:hypothetical protein
MCVGEGRRRTSTPPPCTSSVHAWLWPLMAAQWSAVQPSLSTMSARPPRHSSSRMGSPKPLYAAQCSGDRPSRSGASTSVCHLSARWCSSAGVGTGVLWEVRSVHCVL